MTNDLITLLIKHLCAYGERQEAIASLTTDPKKKAEAIAKIDGVNEFIDGVTKELKLIEGSNIRNSELPPVIRSIVNTFSQT